MGPVANLVVKIHETRSSCGAIFADIIHRGEEGDVCEVTEVTMTVVLCDVDPFFRSKLDQSRLTSKVSLSLGPKMRAEDLRIGKSTDGNNLLPHRVNLSRNL